MKISPLQKARYEYTPKLPGMLRNGIADICVKEGAATQSVADQEKIAELFPNTYGKPEITFEKGQNTSADKKQIVGVILSGGQAPGGHNVICGLYDALKATNKEKMIEEVWKWYQSQQYNRNKLNIQIDVDPYILDQLGEDDERKRNCLQMLI